MFQDVSGASLLIPPSRKLAEQWNLCIYNRTIGDALKKLWICNSSLKISGGYICWQYLCSLYACTLIIIIHSTHNCTKGKLACSNGVLKDPRSKWYQLFEVPAQTDSFQHNKPLKTPDQTPRKVHKHLHSAHCCHFTSFAHETFHYSWKISLGQTALSLAILPKWTIKKSKPIVDVGSSRRQGLG